MIKERLFTPGPTDVPAEVLTEMARPMFHHRTPRFKAMFAEVNEGLKKLFRTSSNVLTLAGSGTAGMEAAIVTCMPRGKKVLVANGGKFGERWAKVARVYGMDVDEVKVQWGTAISPDLVAEKVKTGQYGAVIVVHSETSTATATDVQALGRITGPTDTLLMVDGITSVGALPLETDAWGLDIVASGSQKAMMLPPGLANVAVSEKAWKAAAAVKPQAFYLDLKAYRKSIADSDTPYTPAVSLIRGMKVALDMIHKIGIEKVWARTALLAKATRTAAEAIGLKVYSSQPSDSVTGIWYPQGIDDAFRKALEKTYGCSVAGGQDDIKGKVFRVSHMGYVDPLDTIGLIAATEYTLAKLGVKVKIGAGVAAATAVLRDWE
ncbi:MAG: alanine--glyoxylate aminotransferase family protein [Planctomycetes bacterium]|nr:alanine--glyoxylate aminotransferase family protein [Planctomycetota bacterium]